MRIYLVGFMGAGKSWWGAHIAEQMGFRFVDLDREVQQVVGKPISQIFEEEGEPAFRRYEQQVLHATASVEDIVVATGGGTPLFDRAMDWMNQHGMTVFLRVPVQVLYRRLRAASLHDRPLLTPPLGKSFYSHLREMLVQRLPIYHQAQLIVDADANQLPHIIQVIHEVHRQL